MHTHIHMHVHALTHRYTYSELQRIEWMGRGMDAIWDGNIWCWNAYSFIRTETLLCSNKMRKKKWDGKIVSIFKLKTCLYSWWPCIAHKFVLFQFTYTRWLRCMRVSVCMCILHPLQFSQTIWVIFAFFTLWFRFWKKKKFVSFNKTLNNDCSRLYSFSFMHRICFCTGKM